MFDIVYVSYNSEKWIKKCFESYLNLKYDLKKINIYVVDNCSSDNTISLLEEFKKEYGEKFSEFQIIAEETNWGFGKGNNIGFKNGKSEFVCFLNIDTELFEDTFDELEKEIKSSNDNVGLWEFRQFPYEHPKMYDILTGEVSWASGAAFAVRRKVFAEVDGFDEHIFMYAEDVDLSWKIRSLGLILKYVPRVKITHYSYENGNEIKPNQYVNSVINNLLLRYRYGSKKVVLKGHMMFWNIMRRPETFSGSKKLLLKKYMHTFSEIRHFRAKNKYKNGIGNFIGWDYSAIRDGAFYYNAYPKRHPLVSVIVRTCGRPNVLYETLLSLRRQTYDNFEVVIIEDGEDVSREMIEKNFSDLNVLYKATGEKVGRSKAGNIAMSIAHGEYYNFLDDDDLFYADHIEVLVNCLVNNDVLAAYSTGFETPIVVESRDPYIYEIKDYRGVHKQPFDKIMLCHHNYIPIQCIMFSRELFEKYGGLDEDTEALEDWDMWLRYSLYTDFGFIFKTTSVYRVPYDKEINANRQKDLDDALVYMREKHKKYIRTISVSDILKLYEGKM